jgi:predicted HTH domain antitoxin
MKFQITMEFPDGILPAIRKTPGEFAGEMRLFAAAKYYELGLVSQEKAAEIAGMSREDFLLAISAMGVTPFQYSAEEVIQEVEAWETE